MPEPAAAPSLPDPIRRGPDPAFGPPPPIGRLQPFSPNAEPVFRILDSYATQTPPPRIHLTAPKDHSTTDHAPGHGRHHSGAGTPPHARFSTGFHSQQSLPRLALHGLRNASSTGPHPAPPHSRGTSAPHSAVRSLGAFSARLCGNQKPYALIPLLRSPLTGRLPSKTHSGPATPAGKHREPWGGQIPRFVPGPDTDPAGGRTQ